jgi:predicted nucleic acid-binding Zn ribbon protein
MPTYEFRCPDGTIVEKIFKMSEVPASIPNPNGDGEAVRIISGGAALLFKGSGFYITDYGKDGKKDQRSAANESAASQSSTPKPESSKGEGIKSESSKSESKPPAAPAESKPAAPSAPSKSSDS